MSNVRDSNLIVKSHLNKNGGIMDVTLKNGNRLPKSGLVENIKNDSKYLRSNPNYKLSDNLLNLPHN